MIVDGIGLTIDSFEAIYTTGGAEITEIYAGLNYTDLVYSSDVTMIGNPPFVFTANGRPLKDYTILGNSYQNGVPDPDNPVEVQSVGERTNNLFDKANFTFSDSTTIVYVPIYVGGGSFTLSTDLPVSASGTRDVFFIGGNVSSGANSGTNGVDAAMPRTRNSVDGYVTVATRCNTIRENPADYHYMLNAGSEALPYEGYYKIPVTVRSRNLYNKDDPTKVSSAYMNSSGDIVSGYYGSSVFVTGFIPVKPGTYYTITNACDGGNGNWGAFFDDEGTKVGNRILMPTKLTSIFIGSPSSAKYVRFTCIHRTTEDITMLTEGNSIPESFIPYYLQTVPIYLSDPLRKQLNGNAADEISYATQTLTRRVDANCDPLQTPTTEPITLPTIPTINGQNTLTVDTTVQPSSVSITGRIEPSSIYGNLTDVNGVYIKDKNGLQIKVTG